MPQPPVSVSEGMETIKVTPSLATHFHLRDYDLAATLDSGQTFRWSPIGNQGQGMPCCWTGVIRSRWVRLASNRPLGNSQESVTIITAEAAAPVSDWHWIERCLQVNVDLDLVLATFPQDEPMQAAIAACRGLRLLRQDPWECLASFILSSTKQIVQIRQIVERVCACFGEPVVVPSGYSPAFSFPSAERLAGVNETELRACKMGFRAPYLLDAARQVAEGQLDLSVVGQMPLPDARARLMQLPGVGRKIADCVLLFAYGFQSAFPVDVWVIKALRELYFRGRKTNLQRLQRFAETHFGPNAGYAQQYLFHYMRVKKTKARQLADGPENSHL